MPLVDGLQLFNFCLVLLFGLLLSVCIAGGTNSRRERISVAAVFFLLLLVQGIFWLFWGAERVERLYPLLIHLPLALYLIFGLKKGPAVSIVGILTAYLCCQLPHWLELVLTELSGSVLVGTVGYTVLICVVYWLLRRYFVPNAYAAITVSRPSMLLFGSLPLVYYVFDYATTVYTKVLYLGTYSFYEFFPTLLAVFYVCFLAAYHAQVRKSAEAELQSSMLHAELRQATAELEAMQRSAVQTAAYQHDMRHHLNMIDSLVAVGNGEQALAYIASIRQDLDAIVPRRFCENEAINLLCASFSAHAQRMGVRLEVQVTAPKELPISDTELCSLLSNGLENALQAAAESGKEKWVRLYCGIKRNNLLIEVKNPYAGMIRMEGGVPVAEQEGHGYGCRSILTIVENHSGICLFEADGDIFLLRAVIPLREKQAPVS